MSGTAVIQAGCCCRVGGLCFAHYDDCPGGFGQSYYVRYENGCPDVHPPVIGFGNTCAYFVDVHSPLECSAFHVNCDPNPQVLFPSQITPYNDCESCSGGGPPPTGACCLPDGSCITSTQGHCLLLGGNWTEGASCSPNPCPPPVDPIGACCINGGCIERTQSVCVNAGGTWQGPNTTCTPNPCGGTGGKPGACCIPQQGGVFGLCFNNIGEQACLEAQGLYLGDNTTCGFTDCPPPPYGSGRFAAPPSRGLGDTLMKALSWIGVRA